MSEQTENKLNRINELEGCSLTQATNEELADLTFELGGIEKVMELQKEQKIAKMNRREEMAYRYGIRF